ncbi:unnamed protein product [Rotaria socialis]|uniref:Uncharacterized protein n=1 Tax=Rotaria socialis TaxID=392032 RepID=A0A818CGL7_9BILA|nr:unnamed protein product [Rotaria socialis]
MESTKKIKLNDFEKEIQENRKSNHVNDIDISAYREPGTSQTQEDVMHKDINLLLVRGKSAGDYAWW